MPHQKIQLLKIQKIRIIDQIPLKYSSLVRVKLKFICFRVVQIKLKMLKRFYSF